MNEREVVLDRTGLVQLAGGMALLLTLGFTAGAVVGFGIHEGGNAPSVGPGGPTADALTRTSAPQSCLPDAKGDVRMAHAVVAEPATPPPAAPAVASRPDAVAPVAPRPAAAQTPAHARRYAVQLGVFGVERNANRLVGRLRERGYDPLVTAMRNRSGQWLKRVNLSVFATEDEAVVAARTFRDREGLPAVVVAFQENGS